VFLGSQLDSLWDSLAVGALAYFICIVGVGLYAAYYAAPVDFVALLYLGRISLLWLSKPTTIRVSLVTAIFLSVLLHDAAYSSFRVIERKSVISIRSQLVEFLRSYRPGVGSATVELFFPYTHGKHLMELSSYLRYKGLWIAGQRAPSPVVGPRLVFEGRDTFANNRCIGYRDYACIHMNSAPDAALVIVLPDDAASAHDVETIAKDSTLLFSIKGCAFCTREAFWFRLLHSISPLFWNSQLPEHWLQLHVFRKTPLVPQGNAEKFSSLS
jgi:hypothetical protein